MILLHTFDEVSNVTTLFILFFSETVFQTSVDHIIARQEQKLHCIKLPGKTETTDPCLSENPSV